MPGFKFQGVYPKKNLVVRTPCFSASYPQGVRVPPVKNHWYKVIIILYYMLFNKCFLSEFLKKKLIFAFQDGCHLSVLTKSYLVHASDFLFHTSITE